MHFLLNRFRRGELRLTRIEAFSDGVFAIIVTLLNNTYESLECPACSRVRS
jgi:hypothetical protein